MLCVTLSPSNSDKQDAFTYNTPPSTDTHTHTQGLNELKPSYWMHTQGLASSRRMSIKCSSRDSTHKHSIYIKVVIHRCLLVICYYNGLKKKGFFLELIGVLRREILQGSLQCCSRDLLTHDHYHNHTLKD